MTRIKITPRCDSEVFCSGAASGEAFVNAWTSRQVYHKMEEIESPSFLMTLDHFLCQSVIFFADCRNIFFPQCVLLFRLSNNRLHGDLFEAQICQMQDIGCKIQVVSGKGPSYIIFILMSALRKFFEFRENQVIASFSFAERTHVVMYFFSAVDAEYDICHLTVTELHNLIV